MKRTMMSLAIVTTMLLGMAPSPVQAGEMDRTVGTVIGAVGGGLLGSTLGKGNGRIVATAAGTIFGAVLGHEVASSNDVYERDNPYVRERVVYRQAPVYKPAPVYKTRVVERVVYVQERKPSHNEHKNWKRAARYGDDVLVCNKNGKHCQWQD